MHESIYDKFVELSAARAKRRVVGDPFKPETEQGPQVYLPDNYIYRVDYVIKI